MKVSIFIDGKNFYSAWKDSTNGAKLDFNLMAAWLVEQVGGTNLTSVNYYTGVESDDNVLEGTKGKLQSFLNVVSNQRGWYVKTFERKLHSKKCTSCDHDTSYTQEKEIDTTIVADIVHLNCKNAFDIAILVSGDLDHAPAVRLCNQDGKQVWLASWQGIGVASGLRDLAYDHIDLAQGLSVFAKESSDGLQSILSKLVPSVSENPLKSFVKELATAEHKFEGGYVGCQYFIASWKSPTLTEVQSERWELLQTLLDSSVVETYTAPDGKEAIRLK